MRSWWGKNKVAVIVVLIAGLFICTYLASAFARVSYEVSDVGDRSGESPIGVFFDNAGNIGENLEISLNSNKDAFCIYGFGIKLYNNMD